METQSRPWEVQAGVRPWKPLDQASLGLDLAFLNLDQASLGLNWASWAWLRPPLAGLRPGGEDGWMDGRMDGWTDGRMDGREENSPCVDA